MRFQNRDRGAICRDRTDCRPDLKCLDGECVAWDNGKNCSSNNECILPRKCIFDKCTNPMVDGLCDDDEDCSDDQHCHDHYCEEIDPNGRASKFLIALCVVILIGILIHGTCVLRGCLSRRQRVARPPALGHPESTLSPPKRDDQLNKSCSEESGQTYHVGATERL